MAAILIDVLKAVAGLLLAGYLFGRLSPELMTVGKYWAGFCCIVGHMFPIGYQFKGGRGTLPGGVAALMIDWRLALIVWGCFLICAILTRYIALSSCAAALAFFVAGILLFRNPVITVLSALVAVLVIFKHRGNILRLIRGTEPKFVFRWGGKTLGKEKASGSEPKKDTEKEG